MFNFMTKKRALEKALIFQKIIKTKLSNNSNNFNKLPKKK
jgi:hypothetical protein